VKERPILFSAPMVRAILEGRKVQTRRVVKPQPTLSSFTSGGMPIYDCGIHGKRFLDSVTCKRTDVYPLCPYGQPGDRMWVRETWAHYQTVNDRRRPDGGSFAEVSDGLAGYRADGHETIEDFREHVRLMSGCGLQDVVINGDRWRPSIHMPRWASRIDLEVTGVRVERLQDISEADAAAEGCPCYVCDGPMDGRSEKDCHCFHAKAQPSDFRALWESINGPGSWDANPWVWVVEFERVKP
jgi:hypothetical protein